MKYALCSLVILAAGCQQTAPKPTIDHWEYKYVTGDEPLMGGKGLGPTISTVEDTWELVSVVPISDDLGQRFGYFFKRRK